MAYSKLIIGSTSQLGRFFSEDYKKISSRDIDLTGLSNSRWSEAHVCFAEQRTFLAKSEDTAIRDLFYTTNIIKILEVIQCLQPVCDRIFYYSTAELWNRRSGPISPNDKYCYHSNHYTETKATASTILRDKTRYPNVSIVYPVNFNSTLRSEGYLFAKVFRSIIDCQKIQVGDVDFFRDMVHPSMVVHMVKASVENDSVGSDIIAGSGRVVHVGDFISRLYSEFGMNVAEMMHIDSSQPSIYRESIFYSHKHDRRFDQDALLKLLVGEINTIKQRTSS
jgi:nucleoside-diphosphate-sugar epimerase